MVTTVFLVDVKLSIDSKIFKRLFLKSANLSFWFHNLPVFETNILLCKPKFRDTVNFNRRDRRDRKVLALNQDFV
jgi:hypothetical protein